MRKLLQHTDSTDSYQGHKEYGIMLNDFHFFGEETDEPYQISYTLVVVGWGQLFRTKFLGKRHFQCRKTNHIFDACDNILILNNRNPAPAYQEMDTKWGEIELLENHQMFQTEFGMNEE